MGKAKKHSPEQIVNILRQIEVASANGKTHPLACREAGITEQTFYRWRKEYGGMKTDQAKRLKELEQENSKLKRLVAELSLDKQILQDIATSAVFMVNNITLKHLGFEPEWKENNALFAEWGKGR